jgi:hypothetical protein
MWKWLDPIEWRIRSTQEWIGGAAECGELAPAAQALQQEIVRRAKCH